MYDSINPQSEKNMTLKQLIRRAQDSLSHNANLLNISIYDGLINLTTTDFSRKDGYYYFNWNKCALSIYAYSEVARTTVSSALRNAINELGVDTGYSFRDVPCNHMKQNWNWI